MTNNGQFNKSAVLNVVVLKRDKMYFKLNLMIAVIMLTLIRWAQATDNEIDKGLETPCTCGIFLSGQFKWNSKDQPTGNAALQQELDRPFMKGPIGIRQCTNKCLETIVKHLPNSPAIICATMDRDCFKEKAHLFIKNGNPLWHNTKLSAGREYCCKDNLHYKCPL